MRIYAIRMDGYKRQIKLAPSRLWLRLVGAAAIGFACGLTIGSLLR